MRSTTIFVVFGGLLLAMVLFAALNHYFTNAHPVVRTVKQFMQSVATGDAVTVERIVDTSKYATVTKADSQLGSIRFTGNTPTEGAFAQRPEAVWTGGNLQKLAIDPKTPPVIVESQGAATIKLTNGGKIYFHKVGEAWKIYYISKPEDEVK